MRPVPRSPIPAGGGTSPAIPSTRRTAGGPVPPGVDPMADPEQWEAWLAAADGGDPPPDPEQDPGWCPDPEDPALPDDVDLDAAAGGVAADRRREGRGAGRRGRVGGAAGPGRGHPPGRGDGWAAAGRGCPGRRGGSRASTPARPAGSATGQPLDVAPGGGVLLGFAEDAAGAGDRFAGASDDELAGIIGALDRAEATACSLKHAALAAFTRRRPAPGLRAGGPGAAARRTGGVRRG